MHTIYWLALSLTPGFGGVTTQKLMKRLGGESTFNASPVEIAVIPRISFSIAQQLLNSPIDQI
jgi:hypothetical protein